MNLDFNNYLRGTMIFIIAGFLLSLASKFTPTPFNFFECYGLIMLGVAVKTGYDVYYNNNNGGEF